MTLPPFLLSAALLFWGWQTDLWMFAIPMALLLEGTRLIQWRWDFTATDFRRIANLCLLLLGLLLLYLIVANRSIYLIYVLLQWLPCVFMPLVLTQAYSVSDRIDLQALFLWLNPTFPNRSTRSLNLNLPYFGLCILSASATYPENPSFYAGMVVLLALALWSVRPQRSSAIAWLSLILLAASLGFIGHISLHQLHLSLEQQVLNWLVNSHSQMSNPLEKRTSIGDVGRLKLSNDILFRVQAPPQQEFPLLLRESTFNKYQSSNWLATQSHFTPVPSSLEDASWQLGEPSLHRSTLRVLTTLTQGKGLLTLPDGTFQVNYLPVSLVQKNQYGTVRVEGARHLLTYEVEFAARQSFDSPPTEADLGIPEAEAPTIQQIATQLELEGRPPTEILQRVNTFFLSNFTYSLDLSGEGSFSTPLSSFLLETRSGHCEYFATATALLLRAAGIPTRYATGYSVHDYSDIEHQYVVRSRNAHAWVLVYLNGTWQTYDTTPPDWRGLEAVATPQWQILADLWSLVSLKVALGIRQLSRWKELREWWWLLISPFLALFLLRQLGQARRVRRLRVIPSTPAIAAPPPIGHDSEFYAIEQALHSIGLARHTSESIKQWVIRLQQEVPSSQMQDLATIIDLHYRYRFDPSGISALDRARLTALSQAWLKTCQPEITFPSSTPSRPGATE